MAIISQNSQLSIAIERMLQGLAFWMGYCRAMNELYEHDCVHQAFAILRTFLGRDKFAIKYEYHYSELDRTIKTNERADLVILKKTPKKQTPICVLEFKMSDNTNGGVEADLLKLRKIKTKNLFKFAILLFYDDNQTLASRFTQGTKNALSAKRTAKLSDGSIVYVRRVAKAMATADKPKRNPFMAICIEP